MANFQAFATLVSKKINVIFALSLFGLADRVQSKFNKKLYKLYNINKFALWNGKIFELVPPANLKKLVRKIIEELPTEAGKSGFCVTTEDAVVTADDLIKFKNKMSTPSAINQIIESLQTCDNIEKEESEFDQEVDEIVTQNGILNLKNGILRDHDPDFLSTRIINEPYDRNANCPYFLNFIKQITCNNPELERYLQVLIGYFFTGITDEQQIYIFHGFGSNGKSTLLNILLMIAGLYGIQTPASTLMAKASGGISCDLPRLKKAWLVVASETNENEKLDEARIKIMTGGEHIVARLLFQNLESFLPQFKVVLSANILPEIKGCDHGIVRRIVVVPFDKLFKDADRDKHIMDKLKPELAGIFAWIVEGAMGYLKNGIPNCKAVKDATERYLQDVDLVENFLSDDCICDRNNDKCRISLSDLWEMSISWSRKNCCDPFRKKIFSDLILRKGFKKSRSGSTWVWRGIKPKIKSFQ